MIVLTDVAAKLEEILNSSDCPTDFKFVVKSQGYHLDSIADKKKGTNLIPVFLTMVGGEYNPVPNLHQSNFTYGVDIWFPVRFKETFYEINEYLEEVFVGKQLVIGGKTALCNIGVAEYGEIVGVHLDQFEEWVEDTYSGSVHLFKKEHDISEEYMNMKFNIFATVLGDGFMFGNDVKYELQATFPILIVTNFSFTSSNTTHNCERYATIDEEGYWGWKENTTAPFPNLYFTDVDPSDYVKYIKGEFKVYTKNLDNGYDEVETTHISITNTSSTQTQTLTALAVWDSSGTGASVSPISEQRIGLDKYAKNISNITNFNKSIVVYPQDNDFWAYFISIYNAQNLEAISNFKFIKKYGNGVDYTYSQLVLSVNENIELGSPLSFTLTFGDKE